MTLIDETLETAETTEDTVEAIELPVEEVVEKPFKKKKHNEWKPEPKEEPKVEYKLGKYSLNKRMVELKQKMASGSISQKEISEFRSIQEMLRA